jgi:uncharacterized transporter YbjL
MRLATSLGAGLGLVFGSLAMWTRDPTTAATGTALGLILCALSLTRSKPTHAGGAP